MRPALWFVCFLCQFEADAAPLKAVLQAPQSAVAGSDVYLDASESEGDIEHYLYRVTPELKGFSQIKRTDNAARPRMMSYPGEWTVELIVISKNGDEDRAYVKVLIPGSAPCPEPKPPVPTPIPPTPTPDPQPTPPTPAPDPMPPQPQPPAPEPVPVGTFGIGPKAFAMASKVKSADRAKEAKVLADACTVLASQIAAGTLTDPQALLNEMGVKLKGMSPGWEEVSPQIQAALAETYAAHKNGRLKISGLTSFKMVDPSGWQLLLTEIATGLRAVK